MKRWIQLPLLCLLVSLCAAKNVGTEAPASIELVRVVPNGDKLRIEVQLTGVVNPRVLIAANPARLVLELPNTNARARQQHIAVNQQGVKDLRIGLTSADPMITRVVVDLDCAHPYGLSTEGNTIALTVLPPVPGEDPATIPGMIGNAMAGLTVTEVPAVTKSATKHVQMGFKVKYVAEGVVYLAGGRAAGLEEGMILIVPESKKGGRVITAGDATGEVAELQVLSVAETSAVTEVHDAKRNVKPGDWAYLSVSETAALLENRAAGRKGGVSSSWITVEQGEGLVARAPQVQPREEQRIRGRIGFDYSAISGSVGSSSQVGVVARADMTHIAGTHWNLEGYWRGRITHQSRTEEATLQSVLNKTYTMQLYYDNPESKWVAGFGRLFLPWANSLDVLDGGYLGRKVKDGIIVGAFAGSTPDMTSFRYSPNQRMAGSFVNFQGGSESFRYTSTAGIALNTIKWRLDRPFAFLENEVSYKNTFSVYHSLIADSPQGLTTNGITPGAGISRSYLTVHYQPYRRVGFDVYHNYFRDVPTAATALIGTGLVDKLLYQGVSFGVRAEPIKHVWLYTTLGRSDKTGDVRRSLNQMYGMTIDEIGHTGLRADMRYSKFDSSFGSGDYKLLTLSRHLGDRMMWDAQFGSQRLVSPFSQNQTSNFVDSSFDVNLWGRSFLQSGYTFVHGDQLSYKQWYMSLGWRFDQKPEVNREKEQ
ncbi:MAG TPA: AMIN domain-containing protein [Terriglobales bacterium]|nr:AMIN domain-containing protein [Terriglobales bacterium]